MKSLRFLQFSLQAYFRNWLRVYLPGGILTFLATVSIVLFSGNFASAVLAVFSFGFLVCAVFSLQYGNRQDGPPPRFSVRQAIIDISTLTPLTLQVLATVGTATLVALSFLGALLRPFMEPAVESPSGDPISLLFGAFLLFGGLFTLWISSSFYWYRQAVRKLQAPDGDQSVGRAILPGIMCGLRNTAAAFQAAGRNLPMLLIALLVSIIIAQLSAAALIYLYSSTAPGSNLVGYVMLPLLASAGSFFFLPFHMIFCVISCDDPGSGRSIMTDTETP